jgi:hypothetical protein
MPLVFVHGVSVRAGPSYDRQTRFRNAAFRRHVMPKRDALILNPYWGDIGAKAAWDHASLPGEPVLVLDALGPQRSVPVEQVLISEEAAGHSRPDSVLLEVARQDFREAVDLLVSTAIEESDIDAAALVSVATSLEEYADANPSPRWVREVEHDHAFLERLRQETTLAGRGGDERYGPGPAPLRDVSTRAGVALVAPPAYDAVAVADDEHPDVWEALTRAVDRVREAIADWRWGQPGRSLRRVVQPHLTHFVGDIFVYLKSRGTPARPGDIVRRVAGALDDAAHAAGPGDPLIVVAHSMGANIVVDVLTSFLKHVRVDTLVTVGNQVGWFEEMKLFLASDPRLPNSHQERVPKPANVGRWLNVVDTSDFLAYAAAPIFEGVRDVTFTTGRGPLAAHTEYFKDVSFFKRLGAWLREA